MCAVQRDCIGVITATKKLPLAIAGFENRMDYIRKKEESSRSRWARGEAARGTAIAGHGNHSLKKDGS